jgi:hypothetical protein
VDERRASPLRPPKGSPRSLPVSSAAIAEGGKQGGQ